MKKMFLMAIAAIFVANLFGQEVTPPKAVQDAFTKKFSSVQKVKSGR